MATHKHTTRGFACSPFSAHTCGGGLPFTIVIDRNGQVVQKKMGIMKKADLDGAAELALKGR
jgi:hypothetical protein